MKRISVIIPCYNVENYIDQCILSLINQTIGVDSLEIIAVNDASKDHTMDHLLSLEQQYPQSILVVNCEQNGKQGRARNIGLGYANADYISFVDADDWLEPTAYEKMYKKAVKYNCDAVAAGYQPETSRTSSPMGPNGKNDQYYIIETDTERGGFVGVDFGAGFAGNLYRKSMLTDHQIYFPEGYYYEDDYWYVLSMHYIRSAYIIGEDFYHYYQHPDSTIHKRNSPYQLDRAYVEKLKLEELVRRGIFARFPTLYEHEFIRRYYMDMLYVLFMQFDRCDYRTIRQLHDDTYQIFPNYRDNPFVIRILNGKGGAYMKEVYESLDKELTNESIDSLKQMCGADSGDWMYIRI